MDSSRAKTASLAEAAEEIDLRIGKAIDIGRYGQMTNHWVCPPRNFAVSGGGFQTSWHLRRREAAMTAESTEPQVKSNRPAWAALRGCARVVRS
jgi:hypothetical protein